MDVQHTALKLIKNGPGTLRLHEGPSPQGLQIKSSPAPGAQLVLNKC